MLFVVLIAGYTWWRGRTVPMRDSSSVARVLEIVGVALHAHCKTASTPSTASWMDPSVSRVREAAGGTGSEDSSGGPRVHPSPEDPSVHDKNSFAFASSLASDAGTASPTSPGGHHQLQPGDGLDESWVALVDTACTACLHSAAWRRAFERTLPPEYTCQLTECSKVCHFADGSSTGTRVPVWRLPVFLGGRPGEVHSQR